MPYYVTFYSYKGGVGRTLTLVNVAVSLVHLGRSVFIWELDLEAPGILNLPFFEPLRDKAQGGSVDIIGAFPESEPDGLISRFVLEHPDFEPGRFRLLPAGRLDGTYAGRFASIRWEKLFGGESTAGSQLFEMMRQAVDSYQSDFVLIDSRTGLTDIGGICTVQLADTVVLVYNLSHQNLEGTRNIQQALGQTDRLKQYRKDALKILRVACPVPGDLPELAKERREAARTAGPLDRAARRKRRIQEEFNLTPHFEIPFQPSLLLEERVWAQEFPDDPLSERYRELAGELVASAERAQIPGTFRLAWSEHNALVPGEPFARALLYRQVVELFRLMGFEVNVNLSSETRGLTVDYRRSGLGDESAEVTLLGKSHAKALSREVPLLGSNLPLIVDDYPSFIAVKREPLEEVRFLVECNATAQELGTADVNGFIARLNTELYRENRGLLISLAGFSEQARKRASTAKVVLRSYDELLTALVDWTDYLQWLIQDYRGTEIERLYVEPNVWPETEDAPLVLSEHIEKWLNAEGSTHLTLLGDYGTGKTWFTRRLAYVLATRAQKDPARNRIPIRIDLRQAARALSLENILYDHLQRRLGRDINPKAVLVLLAEGRLVLIFDAFDEMATQSNWELTLENFRELARAAAGNAKVILTCRTHYFKAQSQVHELLAGRKPDKTGGETDLYREVASRKGFDVAHLLEFNSGQIEDYLGRACGERAPEVRSAIERIPGLQDIAARPVLLDMIVKSAPMLQRTGGQVKVANLYEVYTESWLERQDWRLRLTREGRTALVEELAARLWQIDGARIHYRELADVLASLLKDRITTDRELEMADYEVRTASFLTRDEDGHYGFSHRSFLEFFLARRIARLLNEAAGDRLKLVDALRLRLLSPQVLGLLRDLAPEDAILGAVRAILNGACTALCSENALLLYTWMKFDRSRVGRINLAGAQLAGFSLVGCDLARADLRAANLTGADLSNANLTLADLSGALLEQATLARSKCAQAVLREAELTGASLEGADLTEADLSAANLSFASLAGAKLDGATLDRALADGAGFYLSSIAAEQIETIGWKYEPGGPAPSYQELSFTVEPGISSVKSVAYSLDGKLLAAAFFSDSRVFVFDAATGLCRRILAGHTDGVLAVAWGDGGKLASASYDKTIRLWDVDTGQIIGMLEGHNGWIWSLAYHPDWRQLASASRDNTIRLWDVETGKLVRTLEGHKGQVSSVAYRPDGGHLASASADNTIRLWDAETGKLVRTLEGHEDAVMSVAYRPAGGQLASASRDNTIRLWHADTGKLARILEGLVMSVAYRPDGAELASASDDSTIRLWDVETGKLLRTLEGHKRTVWSVAYRPDGAQLASASDDTIRLWDVETGRPVRTLEGHKRRVMSVAYRPDGGEVASASDDDTIRLWDVETGRLVRTLEGHKRWVMSVAYRPDAREIASGSDDRTIRLWDVETGKLLRTLGHEVAVMSVAYRPDGGQLASGSDRTIRLWDVETGKLARTLEGHEKWVSSVAYRPDGGQLASASEDFRIRLWEVKTGKLVCTLEGHESWVCSVAYRPDGGQLASGSGDNTIRLWDVETGKLVCTLEGHKDSVRSVAYRPDGRELASASSDNTIRLWNTETGKLVRTLEGHNDHVSSVAYRPDGRQLASASSDGAIRLWEPGAGKWLVALYYVEGGGWVTVTPDGRFIGDEIGKRHSWIAHRWALYPVSLFPELEDPKAIRNALSLRGRTRKAR